MSVLQFSGQILPEVGQLRTELDQDCPDFGQTLGRILPAPCIGTSQLRGRRGCQPDDAARRQRVLFARPLADTGIRLKLCRERHPRL